MTGKASGFIVEKGTEKLLVYGRALRTQLRDSTIKSFLLLFFKKAGLALLLTTPAAAETPPVCISNIRLDHTEVVDDHTILFHMRDRSVYRNTLPQSCFGLRNDPRGFTYEPTDNSDRLCSNLMTIRLNSLGSICMLGPFVRVQTGAKY